MLECLCVCICVCVSTVCEDVHLLECSCACVCVSVSVCVSAMCLRVFKRVGMCVCVCVGVSVGVVCQPLVEGTDGEDTARNAWGLSPALGLPLACAWPPTVCGPAGPTLGAVVSRGLGGPGQERPGSGTSCAGPW